MADCFEGELIASNRSLCFGTQAIAEVFTEFQTSSKTHRLPIAVTDDKHCILGCREKLIQSLIVDLAAN